MREQGRSTLLPDESGRIMDRLAGLGKGRFSGDRARGVAGHRARELAGLSAVARGPAVGGVGQGTAHRLADSTGVPTRGATSRFRNGPAGARLDSGGAWSRCGNGLRGSRGRWRHRGRSISTVMVRSLS